MSGFIIIGIFYGIVRLAFTASISVDSFVKNVSVFFFVRGGLSPLIAISTIKSRIYRLIGESSLKAELHEIICRKMAVSF